MWPPQTHPLLVTSMVSHTPFDYIGAGRNRHIYRAADEEEMLPWTPPTLSKKEQNTLIEQSP